MLSVVIAVWAAACAALPVPDFELLDPAGATVRLFGRVSPAPVVLDFTGTECPSPTGTPRHLPSLLGTAAILGLFLAWRRWQLVRPAGA